MVGCINPVKLGNRFCSRSCVTKSINLKRRIKNPMSDLWYNSEAKKCGLSVCSNFVKSNKYQTCSRRCAALLQIELNGIRFTNKGNLATEETISKLRQSAMNRITRKGIMMYARDREY